jgi:hypothetical protein
MTTRTATAAHNPLVWTSGDWNAFFGFGTNMESDLISAAPYLSNWISSTMSTARQRSNNGHLLS